jgi:hypothetical protein
VLIVALSDAAELVIDGNAHEVIAGWRATARIKADKRGYARALAQTDDRRVGIRRQLATTSARPTPSGFEVTLCRTPEPGEARTTQIA